MTPSRTDIKIFLGCLPASSDAGELTEYFQKYCRSITKMKIKYRSNKVCAGYGHFIADIDERSLEKMTSAQHYYKDRSIECRLYLTGTALADYQIKFNQRRIYAGNLPPSLNEREFFKTFSQFGKVQRAYIANNPDKEGKTFGFVVYFDELTAKKVIKKERIQNYGRIVTIKPVTVQKQKIEKKKKKDRGEKQQEENKLEKARCKITNILQDDSTENLHEKEVENSTPKTQSSKRISGYELFPTHKKFIKLLNFTFNRLPKIENGINNNLLKQEKIEGNSNEECPSTKEKSQSKSGTSDKCRVRGEINLGKLKIPLIDSSDIKNNVRFNKNKNAYGEKPSRWNGV